MEIMDWGSDMSAYNEWAKTHPPEAAGSRADIPTDDTRVMDRMFDRTRYEQKSYEAYSRLLDQGHRA